MRLLYAFLVALFFGLISFSACTKQESVQITGDLYFPWLKLGNFYGQPDSVYQYYKGRREKLGFDSLKKEDPQGVAFMQMLEDNELLFEPYIYLQLGKDKNVICFMDSTLYEQFTHIDYHSLRAEKMKIRIRASAKKISPLAYIVEEIRRVDKVPGETLLVEKKFRIENYK